MSLTPVEPSGRRDWTLPIVVAAVAVVVLLALCVAGGITAWTVFRQRSASTAASPPPPAPSQAPPSAPAGPAADCLLGNWSEVSYANWADIYGAHVQLTGKGLVMRFGPDGVNTSVLDNLVRTGTAGGDTYEVVFNGTTQINYQADATTIYYSDPKTDGTTTWKVNGKVRASEKMSLTLQPDTYKCQGNDLRLYSDDYAAEFKRILPPGVPV